MRPFLLTVTALLPMIAGCGGPDVADVVGTVRLKGQPLVGAVVVFSPKPGQELAKTAVAITDDAGVYRLETHFDGNRTLVGAMPGEYTVTVSKIAPPGGMSEAKYQALIDAEEARQQKFGYTGETSVPNRTELVPAIYSHVDKTKLTAKVESNGGKFDFEIP